MKNKRKHPDQADKVEEIAKKKLAKLCKVSKPETPNVVEIKRKVVDALESRKNANNIIDIISHLKITERSVTATAAINGVNRIFMAALEKNEVAEKEVTGTDSSVEEKYKGWMLSQLQETVRLLCGMFHHSKASVASQALSVVMALLRASFEARGAKDRWGQVEKQMLHHVVLSVCSTKRDSHSAIARIQQLLGYADVKIFFLKHLKKIITTAVSGNKVNNIFINNVIGILEVVDMASLDLDTVAVFLCRDQDPGHAVIDRVEAKNLFSDCWLSILKCRINLAQYKKVLVMLQDKVMPYLSRPFLLTDFLLSSYSVGGSISLLALSSVFTLISKHNLEFPQFYKKLYQLFTAEIFHVKYKARFFHLSDLFLSSTHLPEYLVAAFVKRIARLCLTAPAPTIPMAVRFIHNLLHRHPGLARLIDGSDTVGSLQSDPFDNMAEDPADCRAIDSSLWEIETLQNHALPQVSTAAKDLIEKGLRQQELDVSSMLEMDWSDVMEIETKKKVFPNVPTNWEKPDGLKMIKDDIVWQIFAFA